MESIKDYFVSIVATAILCSLASSLLGKKGTSSAIINLICGVIMAATIILPWKQIRIPDITSLYNELLDNADAVAFSGQLTANEATAEIIKSKSEAYILDKASDMGLSIEVEVTVSNDNLPIPSSIRIVGAVSPFAKKQLSNLISCDLGIPEDNQLWI